MKLPIIILSSKRTGSTALMSTICEDAKKDNINLQVYLEPSENNTMTGLLETIEKTDRYIVKAHAYDVLTDFPTSIKDIITTHNCFLIRIRRRNLINQIASHYLASQRNIWNYTQSITPTPSLPIDIKRIHRSIKIISAYNAAIDNFSAVFDLDMYYEDLILSTQIDTIETPKPGNYNLLLQTIKAFI